MRQHEDEVCLLRQCPGSGISLIEAGDSKSVDLKSGDHLPRGQQQYVHPGYRGYDRAERTLFAKYHGWRRVKGRNDEVHCRWLPKTHPVASLIAREKLGVSYLDEVLED